MGRRSAIRGWYLPDYREKSYHEHVNSNFTDIEILTQGFSNDGSVWSGERIEVEELDVAGGGTSQFVTESELDSLESDLRGHQNNSNNPHNVSASDVGIDSAIESHRTSDTHTNPQPPRDHVHSEYIENGDVVEFESMSLDYSQQGSDGVVRRGDLMDALPDEVRIIHLVDDDSDPTSNDGELVART